MSYQARNLLRWNRISLWLGGCVWGVVALASLAGWLILSDLQVILLLALLVMFPLAALLVWRPQEDRLWGRLVVPLLYCQPVASLLGGVALFLNRGLLAASFAAAWFLFTVLLALIALLWLYQLLHQPRWSLADLCLLVAWLYLPVGSAWMVLACWGLQPLGFGVHTDQLTAVHFHFIALAALIITGLTGKALQALSNKRRGLVRIAYCIAAIGVLIDPLLVAAGITSAQIAGLYFVDAIPAELLALCLILLSLLGLCFVVPTTTARSAQVLLILSYTAVFFTMLFAAAYALGEATSAWMITIPQMVLIHGLENALIFGFCGLLGWRIRIGEGETRGVVCA